MFDDGLVCFVVFVLRRSFIGVDLFSFAFSFRSVNEGGVFPSSGTIEAMYLSPSISSSLWIGLVSFVAMLVRG